MYELLRNIVSNTPNNLAFKKWLNKINKDLNVNSFISLNVLTTEDMPLAIFILDRIYLGDDYVLLVTYQSSAYIVSLDTIKKVNLTNNKKLGLIVSQSEPICMSKISDEVKDEIISHIEALNLIHNTQSE